MTVKLWVFIDQLVKKCFLADNHSKVLLFKSDSGKMVSIVTSQNLTRGNRYESCVITTDPQIFNSLFSSFMEMVDNYSVPLSEIMEKVSDFTVLTDGVSERDS